MLQPRVQQHSGLSGHLNIIPGDIFLLNPHYAGRVIGRSRFWSIMRREFTVFAFLVCFSALLFVIVLQSIQPLLDISHIEQSGILTQALITYTYAVDTTGKSQFMYQVEYGFTDASGTLFSTNQIVSVESFEQFHAGDLVPVRYIPNNPTLSILTDWAQDDTTKMSNLGVGLTSLASFLSVLAATWFMGLYVRREDRFFGQGHLIIGHVLACHTHSGNSSVTAEPDTAEIMAHKRSVISVSYSFRTPDGHVIKPAVLCPRYKLGSTLPQFGDSMAVLYLDNGRYKLL